MADGVGSGSHYFALPTGSKLYEFEIEALLGHGGFGITYRATDTLLQETVAIKEYLPNELAVRVSDATVRAKSQQGQPDFDAGLKSFLEEARVMARFRHPRIVHVRRFFEMHGTGYIVLDYERGQTLSERLSDGPIPDSGLRNILSGVLDGLEVIHARAILHRDLKPNNIMLREDGAPVIIDFGAARDFQARHSRSITAIATAGYAPPEQYGVGGQQGPWSDLYALGAIAYRAVSGVPPVDSLRRLRKDPLIPAVVAGAGKYDEALLRTIDWMLKIDEEDRPVSVAQVREALRGGPVAEAGSEISHSVPARAQVMAPASDDLARTSGTQSGIPEAAHPSSRRGKVAAIAISLVVLAGLAAGSYAFYANYQAKQQTELQAKQQAARLNQQAAERQRQFAEQLANAGTDPSKLEQFLTACGSTCPAALRTEAQARIDTVKQQQAALPRQAEAPKDISTPVSKPKSPDRVGQPSSSDQVAPVAQRVVLYDEDPGDPKGKQFVGSVVWRTEQVKAAGQKADIAVRADIDIPDRKFKMTMSFRRNTDTSLPASHTAELTFILPPDFAGGGVSNVPGILMKSNEQARGTPLAGLAVKVTEGFFLVGLSNVDADRARNLQLLKERSWFDVPLVYVNQRRAIIAVEKGAPGERAFNDAFGAWGE